MITPTDSWWYVNDVDDRVVKTSRYIEGGFKIREDDGEWVEFRHPTLDEGLLIAATEAVDEV